MKKILFIIVLIVGAVNFRDHPQLKPYTDNILNLVSTKAKNTAGVIDRSFVFDNLKNLESTISSYEYRFVVDNITDIEQATQFYQKQCHDTELAHAVLTQYAIKKICGILNNDLD